MDDEPAVPKWLPRTQLWIGLTRWGIAAAASVIEARVQELGGVPREESVTDRAARLEREMNAAKARREFLNSEAGVKAACDEFAALAPALKALASEIQSRAPSISIGLRESPNYLLVHGLQHAVGVAWKGRYANTLDGAALTLTLWDSHPPFPGFVVFEKPAALHGTKFSFDVLPDGRVCWRADNEPSRFYTTTDLAAFILKHYMDHQPNDPQR